MGRESPPAEMLMAYLDGELPPKEEAKFRRLLEAHPEWREEVEEMAAVVGATRRLKLKRQAPEFWDNYWEEIDARLPKRAGWFAALAGAALLIAVGCWKVMANATNDFVRAGLFLTIAGMLILFVTVVKGRLSEIPRDRYRRVRR